MSDEVVPELAWQMGRPIRYGGEYKGFNERSNYVASIAADALAPIIVEDSASFERRIERVAHGVVFVIAPWNYPYMTAINTIAPALMAGNTVMLKHASPDAAGRRAHGARLCRGRCSGRCVPEHVPRSCDDVGADCGRSFNFVNFTGSVEGGRSMERAAAGTFTGLGLELGGKDPGYVMEDADLDAAVDTLMDGATFNSGQCCCGIERIYVHETSMTSFVEKPSPGCRTTSSAIRWTRKPRSGRWPQALCRGARADRRCGCQGRQGAGRSEAVSAG
jgi:acyl-CoA reductase-like NAD-dependent aldehyde dehydrogenase